MNEPELNYSIQNDKSNDESNSLDTEDESRNSNKMFSFKQTDGNEFNILHPDDPLMQRFQDALKAHLLRMDNKLSEEIRELKHKVKYTEKEGKEERDRVENLEVDIMHQRKVIGNYQNFFTDMAASREKQQEEVENSKAEHNKKSEELKEAEEIHYKLVKEKERLSLEEKYYAILENEITSEVSISKRISEKEARVQQQLLREKKQKDYILFKLDEEIWKMNSERKHLLSQLELKEEDKNVLGQAISDANAEIEALQKEVKELLKNWNQTFMYIKQRDEISAEQTNKCKKMQITLQSLKTELDNIKKETYVEMENNETLMESKSKVEKDVQSMTKEIHFQRKRKEELENELEKLEKISQHCEEENKEALAKLQDLQNIESELNKEIETSNKKKTNLEDQILEKLNDAMMEDKKIKHMNKELQETKQKNKEYDYLTNQAENTYDSNLLSITKLKSVIDEERFNLGELIKINVEREMQLQKTEANVKRIESNISVKVAKLFNLKKKIEELLHATKGEDVNIYDLKITALKKSIEEVENKNKEASQFWLRQERNLMDMRGQRNIQLEEISLLTKQIMIIEQKNYKLEYEMEKQKKEQNNINRKIRELQQVLIQKSSQLAERKDFRQHLEDVNYVTRNETAISLEEAEKELTEMQTEIKKLKDKQECLKNNVREIQLECLSWEKKVKVACEMRKVYEQERKGGGDIAMMKSEIHKMEMRLSQLKKFQQKLIQDMECCISKRENIMDRVIAEEKKNPQNEHNRRIIIRKRLDDQKLKIKIMKKEIKQIEDEILKLENTYAEFQDKIDDTQKAILQVENNIADLDKETVELEMIKNYNFETIVRRQRRVRLLQNIKDGKYKMSCKPESVINETKKQENLNEELKEILNQTKNDFPLLEIEIQKMLMSLDI